ncbi:MAG: hypothetical protein ACJ762_18705 [Solirubrobacteraceae bacterium]
MQPLDEVMPVELTFDYEVGDDWFQQEILETGNKPSKRYRIKFSLGEIPDPPTRKALLKAKDLYDATDCYPEVAEPTDDPLLIIAAVHEAYAAENEDSVADVDEQTYRSEMAQWIAVHGSKRLKEAHERGYIVDRLYALERVARDWPGMWVDIGRTAEINPRANPSEAALHTETDVLNYVATEYPAKAPSVRIVWLKTFPRDMQTYLDEHDEFFEEEQGEAILLEPWLGRYRLILPVDPDLRAPEEVE